jgi:type 1 glutamine amidotransferase
MRTAALLLATSLLLGVTSRHPYETVATPSYKVLVFTHATGYKHASIAAGVTAIRRLGREHGFSVTATADPAAFTDARLRPYATVVFLSTTGNPLPGAAQRKAFQRYIASGGGFVGVHAASDLSVSWPWYTRLVGASFARHPVPQLALVHVEDHQHPATRGLADRWRMDEWYDFAADPRGTVHVLADVEDASYQGSAMGTDHPVTWCQDVDGGRSFYTAMGHAAASFTEPWLLHVVLGGIETTAGVKGDDCATP